MRRRCVCTRSCTVPRAPSVAVALENLGGIYVKLKRHDAAEPLFQRALKIRQDTIGPNHAFSATGHANLGSVYLARGNWAAALNSYRQAIRLLVGQDTSFTIIKSIVDEDIRRHRDTFVGLCRAAWQTRPIRVRRRPAWSRRHSRPRSTPGTPRRRRHWPR